MQIHWFFTGSFQLEPRGSTCFCQGWLKEEEMEVAVQKSFKQTVYVHTFLEGCVGSKVGLIID